MAYLHCYKWVRLRIIFVKRECVHHPLTENQKGQVRFHFLEPIWCDMNCDKLRCGIQSGVSTAAFLRCNNVLPVNHHR